MKKKCKEWLETKTCFKTQDVRNFTAVISNSGVDVMVINNL